MTHHTRTRNLVHDGEVSMVTKFPNNQTILYKTDMMAAANSYLAYKIGVGILQYIQPVLICSGICGNTLSLFVMLQQRNRKLSCCNLMGALAVSDNLFLSVCFYYWFNSKVLE